MAGPTAAITSEPVSFEQARAGRAEISPFFLTVVSALLLWLAFPPADRGYLGWVAMVPLVVVVLNRKRPRWQVYLSTWLGGMVFWHLAISWVNLAAPSAWLGWTVMASFLSLGWLLFAGLTRLGVIGLGLPPLVVVPVAFLVEEYYRAFTSTGFPWYYLGQTQYRFTALIQVADVAGVWGVSLLVALVNVALAGLWIDREAGAAGGSVGGFKVSRGSIWRAAGVAGVVLSAWFYGQYRISTAAFTEGPRVALLQSDIEQDLKMNQDPDELMERFHVLVNQALVGKPDLIVWPETAYPRGFPDVEPALERDEFERQVKQVHPESTIEFWRQKELIVRQELFDWVSRIRVPMVVGATTYSFSRAGLERFNSAILIRPDRPDHVSYHKLHLLPFGEYVPLLESMPWLIGLTPYEEGYIPSLVPGKAPRFFELGGVRYATAICFEDTVPYVVRRSFRDAGSEERSPDVLLNLSNDGWFRGSSELRMHVAASVFRAVEHRVPMARAVNTGGTSVIDGNGRILSLVANNKADVLVAAIPLDTRTSFYSKWGDWLPRICVFLAVFAVLFRASGKARQLLNLPSRAKTA